MIFLVNCDDKGRRARIEGEVTAESCVGDCLAGEVTAGSCVGGCFAGDSTSGCEISINEPTVAGE